MILSLANIWAFNGHFEHFSVNVFGRKMASRVRQLIRSRQECSANKSVTVTQRKLQTPEIPSQRWQDISMNFVTGLRTSLFGNNAILVVCDRLTTRSHFIPCKDTDIAFDISKLFIADTLRTHGDPCSIVSDRDPKFTRNFWKELMEHPGCCLRLSKCGYNRS